MKKIIFILTGFLFFTENVLGQNENSMLLRREIDQYFKTIHENSPAPGFSVVVVKKDKVIFLHGYGVEKAGFRKPMTATTSTAIGSLTKSITAMAMMQLVEQGKVSLDDPVIKYLPEFHTANKERSDKITVRMLINNTSGLYGGVTKNRQDIEKSMELLMSSLQSIFLKREPGSSYEYSNAAFSIAGLLISRVSGMTYPEYLKKHIFDPLEMGRSTTDPADFNALQVLYGHHFGISGGITAEKGIESGEMAPAGSMLRSSAEDMGHYLVALLNDGKYKGNQILSKKSIEELWSPQISFPGLTYDQGGDGSKFNYGLGWMIAEVEGRTIINHGGSRKTMSSMTILDPKRQLAATILFNLDYNFLDNYRFQSEFNILNNLFHLLEKEEFTDFGNPRIQDPTLNDYELPDAMKQRFIGEYRFASGGEAWYFQGVNLEIFIGKHGNLEARAMQADELIMEFALDFTNEANAVSRNTGAPKSIHFKIRPDGIITGLYLSGAEFNKITPAFLEKYGLMQLEDLSFSFYFPKDWTITKHGNQFEATKEPNSSTSISGVLEPNKVLNFHEVIAHNFPDHQVLYEGAEMTEVRGRYLWVEKAFSTECEGTSYQHLVLLNNSGAKGFYLILTTPFGKLTRELQDVVGMFVETFTSQNL